MSWIEKLYRTYEQNTGRIGDRNDTAELLPVCHTLASAHIHVIIDMHGEFRDASLVLKDEARTVIPATEESAGRTSGPVPHPLCDKLQYVASDYAMYGGDKCPQFPTYYKNLRKWALSTPSDNRARTVLCTLLRYVRKKRLVSDLVAKEVLHVEIDGTLPSGMRLLNQWSDKKNTPGIFKLLAGGPDSKGKKKPWQADAFIRWSVEFPGQGQSAVWTDEELWRSWAEYYGRRETTKGLCYVTGAMAPIAKQHPRNIRYPGDGGKLICSPSDPTNYLTYLGRFTNDKEACGVSSEVTQKAHNALRWLIPRQGYRDGDQVIVAWAVSGAEVPDPHLDTYELALGRQRSDDSDETGKDEEGSQETAGYTAQEIGIQFSKRIAGYAAKLGDTTEVVVLGLDSATEGGKGPMAITFYRELTGSELLERVQAWHEGCCWLQRFEKDKVFVGAPAPRDIAEAAYGRVKDRKKDEAKKKLCKTTVERLLPCIIDGAPIPHDLVQSCVRRASSRQSFKWERDKARSYVSWEWEKALGIACALYRYQHKERSYSMALERDRRTRDYLYGRLLALAERLEGLALYVAGEERETNAGRLMQRFAQRPHTTWLTIATALNPYKERLRAKRAAFLRNIEAEIDEVHHLFLSPDDFIGDHPLEGEFLLGYHCQRRELWPKASQSTGDAGDIVTDGTDDDMEV